jgi:hypothetical protein
MSSAAGKSDTPTGQREPALCPEHTRKSRGVSSWRESSEICSVAGLRLSKGQRADRKWTVPSSPSHTGRSVGTWRRNSVAHSFRRTLLMEKSGSAIVALVGSV